MVPSRRRFLQITGASLLVGCRGYDLGLTGDETFDEMLDLLHRTAVDYDNGLSNHAPMGAEALVALGASDRAVSWVADYSTRLSDNQDPAVIQQVEALLVDMDSDGPQAVTEREVAELADGWVGAGWHGVLRAAHAVRSLIREDTPSRRRELAFGLAYWRRDHFPLPGAPGSAAESGFAVDDLLDAIPLVADGDRVSGFIVDRFAPLAELDGFAATVARLDLDAETVEDAIHTTCAAVARAWTDDGSTGGSAIVLAHAITGTSALRLLLPWLSSPTARTCLGFAAQAAAAGLSAHGARPATVDDSGPSATEIGSTSAEADDEHTIKLGEAVLRELDHAPAPELRTAFALW